jgi:hypothetical protein
MAQANIKAVITAEDRASGTVAKFGNNIEKSSMAMNLAFAAAGTAVVAFGVQSFRAYSEAEKQSKMLEHAVVDVTHATRQQLDQTNALADALEKKGVLDGDNIKQGLAQLSTFGLSNKAVQALGGSLADLAVNQYGVSASGEQLSDSANMIAKALNGQFGILEKSGIRFTDAQKSMIEFGTEEQKVDAINQGFAQNLKYTNEIAAQTSEGALARLQVTFGNLQEKIGGVVAQGLTPMVTRLNDFVNQNPVLVEKITLVTITVGALTAGIWALNTALTALGGVLSSTLGRVSAIVAGLAFLVYQMQVTANIGNNLNERMSGMAQSMANARQRVIEFIGPLGGVTSFLLGIAGAANNAAYAIDRFINRIPILNSITPDFAKIPQGRAVGGSVSSGTPYIVGEKGPELFVPHSSGNIVPNDKMSSSTNNNTTININVGLMTGSAIERREAAAKMFEDLKDIASQRGQSVGQMIGA